MIQRAITASFIFDGHTLHQNAALRIEDGVAVALCPDDALPGDEKIERVGDVITPGFLDIQVNGGGGVLFNARPDPAGLGAIAAAHRRLGTTAMLATVITDEPSVTRAAAHAVLEVHGTGGVLGIHIEGPHIAPARKGAHNADYIRPLDDETIHIVDTLRNAGVPVVITLAPEAVQPGQIARLSRSGAIVSIGHSDATPEQVRAALAEGASLFTHLMNGMPPIVNRAPGVVGAAILSQAYCSVICDGIHVAPDMLKLIMAARPVADRMILISDAMPSVGGPQRFELYGETIRVEGGRLVNAEGSLAGAHTTMLESLAFVRNVLNVPLETALRMAITNPSRALNLPVGGGLIGASLDDVLVCSKDLRRFATVSRLARIR